jgi:gluconate kinase
MAPKKIHFIDVCMVLFQIRTIEIPKTEMRAVLDEVQQGKNLIQDLFKILMN